METTKIQINKGISYKKKKIVSKLEKELQLPLNHKIKMKLYHDKQVDFTDCKHSFRFNQVLIPCQQIINAPVCYYYVPSVDITLRIPKTRVYAYSHVNSNSIKKFCQAQKLKFFLNDD